MDIFTLLKISAGYFKRFVHVLHERPASLENTGSPSPGLACREMEASEYFKNESHKTSKGRSQAKRLSGGLISSYTIPVMSDIS